MPGPVSDSYEGPSDETPEIPAWALKPLDGPTPKGEAAGFVAVDFPDQYPRQNVADHEVLMAFRGDSDALAFREWWQAKGATLFGRWLRKQKGQWNDDTP